MREFIAAKLTIIFSITIVNIMVAAVRILADRQRYLLQRVIGHTKVFTLESTNPVTDNIDRWRRTGISLRLNVATGRVTGFTVKTT